MRRHSHGLSSSHCVLRMKQRSSPPTRTAHWRPTFEGCVSTSTQQRSKVTSAVPTPCSSSTVSGGAESKWSARYPEPGGRRSSISISAPWLSGSATKHSRSSAENQSPSNNALMTPADGSSWTHRHAATAAGAQRRTAAQETVPAITTDGVGTPASRRTTGSNGIPGSCCVPAPPTGDLTPVAGRICHGATSRPLDA